MATYLDQIQLLTISSMKSRYRGTFAGFVWVVMNPIILFSVQALVFKHFLKINVPNYSLFLLGGLLPWLFILQAFDMCIPVLQNSTELLKAYRIKPSILIWAQLLDNFFNFTFAFVVILIPTIILAGKFSFGLLFIPIALLNLIVGVGGAVRFFSVLQVFYKDTKFIIQFLTSIMFFLTPIFYPISKIPENLRWMVQFNPFYRYIEPFRICIYGFDLMLFLKSISFSLILTLLIIMLAHLFWEKRKNEFYLFI